MKENHETPDETDSISPTIEQTYPSGTLEDLLSRIDEGDLEKTRLEANFDPDCHGFHLVPIALSDTSCDVRNCENEGPYVELHVAGESGGIICPAHGIQFIDRMKDRSCDICGGWIAQLGGDDK